MTKPRNLLLSTVTFGVFCLLVSPVATAAVIDINKSVSDNGITPDLLYWNFDGDANDSSPSGYDGTLDKGSWGELPSYVGGKFGDAINLKGTSGNLICDSKSFEFC